MVCKSTDRIKWKAVDVAWYRSLHGLKTSRSQMKARSRGFATQKEELMILLVGSGPLRPLEEAAEDCSGRGVGLVPWDDAVIADKANRGLCTQIRWRTGLPSRSPEFRA
ncbi:hypothetical protein H920_05283 [Fukomys damarensis]|uniref:Uncharacterized protein n=1 Tax=Fukomys damarensis TaxID=885580 RepID=A0A091DS54_FUKDA|nr:hypothetical protein H920_05283 [Fukomys damarensis]